MDLYLMYFDTVVGPRVFLSDPDPPDADRAKLLGNIMDLATKQGFFEHREAEWLFLNFYFEIPSSWARGKKEMVMLTAITKKNVSIQKINAELERAAQEIKQYPTLYTAFYRKKKEERSEVLENYTLLRKIIEQTIDRLRSIADQAAFGDILVLGHEDAGKSAILERLSTGIFQDNIKHTISLQILKTIFQSMKLRIFDIGGSPENRGLGFKACPNPKAIIFVVDYTADQHAIQESREEFQEIVTYYYDIKTEANPNYPPLLILANKIDLVDEPSELHVASILGFQGQAFIKIPHKIMLVSAKTNAGIREGFRWLVQTFLASDTGM